MGLQRIQPIDSPWHIEMGKAKKVFSCSISAFNLPFFLGGWVGVGRDVRLFPQLFEVAVVDSY